MDSYLSLINHLVCLNLHHSATCRLGVFIIHLLLQICFSNAFQICTTFQSTVIPIGMVEKSLIILCNKLQMFFRNHKSLSVFPHSSLLTAKSGNLVVVARDGFLCVMKIILFFIVGTLITEVHFKQFLICTAL